jgi:hypothetical protein
MSIELKAGDIFLTRGSSVISRLIRFFSRSIGENRTMVNHVGLIVEPGVLRTAVEIEAIRFVTRRTLWSGYGPPDTDCVAIFRANNLTEDDVRKITARAQSMVSVRYGWITIVAHLLDWCLNGAYVFRRLVPDMRYPICSWLVADAFAKAGRYFGVAPGAAEPDDIWDYVTSSKHAHYVQVYPLQKLADSESNPAGIEP